MSFIITNITCIVILYVFHLSYQIYYTCVIGVKSSIILSLMGQEKQAATLVNIDMWEVAISYKHYF